MTPEPNYKDTIAYFISELDRAVKSDIVNGAIALTYVGIDTMAYLAMPREQAENTRADFIGWVTNYMKGHSDQEYKYEGEDVYYARCAFLHSYGSHSSGHTKNPKLKKFGYSNGGKHKAMSIAGEEWVIIGMQSFANDFIYGVHAFLSVAQKDKDLRERIEIHLENLILFKPVELQDMAEKSA